MASSNNFDFPRFPPPPAHFQPPPPSPPNVRPPPPPPLPPAPSPSNNSTTVVLVVFVSLGGVFFLAFLAFALCCFIKKRKKRVQETDVIQVDEHLKVKEAIVEGPNGPQSVVLQIEDDVHVNEVIKKQKEENFGDGLHNAKNKSLEIGALPSSSASSTHSQLQNKA
ncbi:protein TRACHEARY ELEMENT DIFFERENTIATION-RELATED 6 [Ricinus communis]|uniref:Uncharacterized protein n=1 Tax=Ricinus communis TaxID=3988 RepID=B9SJJ3_RICCO|nr:protein TRACHEARY ELEMENT DIFFERENTIATION-RELATED 6 [Ricinus communis]EEF36238.1 conserved hypothetical protein [Ricinus communis]|eukprot:XP_002526162.1 probable inactive receptor kinase At5g58300 [Ricinus communis]